MHYHCGTNDRAPRWTFTEHQFRGQREFKLENTNLEDKESLSWKKCAIIYIFLYLKYQDDLSFFLKYNYNLDNVSSNITIILTMCMFCKLCDIDGDMMKKLMKTGSMYFIHELV